MDRTEDRSKEPKTKLVLDDGRIESIQEFISPEELYQDLIERVRKYHPSDDISMIEKAYRLASSIRCAWRLSWRIWSWIRRRSWRDFCTMWWKIP